MDLLKKYCLKDVQITKQVYEYALKNSKLLYQDYFTIKEMTMNISEPKTREGVLHQTVLF